MARRRTSSTRNSKRKIIVYIATSADGFIARLDGSVDWLNRPQTAGDYGMSAFRQSIDAIVMGRTTYEFGLTHGAKFGGKTKHYVFSRDPSRLTAAPGVKFVSEQTGVFATRLRSERGKDIWIMGGAELIATFLDEDQIDEFIIHVIPTLIGEGIPLMQPRHRYVPLKLKSVKRFADGVVRLHYLVTRERKQ